MTGTAGGHQIMRQRDGTKATVRYAEGPPCAIEVKLIHSWDRGSIIPISGGSGMKDYTKNEVWSIFEKQPAIDRIVMVRANGPTFYLLRIKGELWFDVTGKQVVAEIPETAP